MNDWTEIRIKVPNEYIDAAGDIAQMAVPYGIYIEDYSMLEEEVEQIAHIDLIDEELLQKDRTKGVVHIYINPEDNPAEAVSFLRERYTSENIPHEIELENCAEEDWLNNWKQYFNPIEIGEKLLIRPTWRSEYDPGSRAVLNLDPGVAFGTGGHETTRLVLGVIEKVAAKGKNFLDVGCGSGILAVAGLLLGCDEAFGVDIDEMAVKTAKENAALNDVSDRFTVVCGDLTDKVSGKYDIIAANIVADAIIALTADIKKFMKPDTIYIMSGIIDSRSSEVEEFVSRELDIIEKLEDNGWVCLTAKLKAQ